MRIKFIRGVKSYYRKVKLHHPEREWVQEPIQDKTIQSKLIKMIGYKGARQVDCILHGLSTSVDWHTDRMSKSCYLIPVKCSPGWSLEIEERTRDRVVELKVGEAYKFNDFDRHGLFMTDRAKGMAIFYTVSITAS